MKKQMASILFIVSMSILNVSDSQASLFKPSIIDILFPPLLRHPSSIFVPGSHHHSARYPYNHNNTIYFGIGIGFGVLKIDGETVYDRFEEDNNIYLPLVLILQWVLNLLKKNHMGFDFHYFTQDITSKNQNETPYDTTLVMANYLFLLSFYPFNEGLFFKTGVGYGTFNEDHDRINDNNNDDIPDNKTYGGVSYIAGAGFDIPVGSFFHVGFHIDYLTINFSNKNRNYEDTESIMGYLGCYWYF